MLNILHLINYTGGGGTESYIYSLGKQLHNSKCKFFIGYSEEGPSLEKFQQLGIETIHIPMNSPYDFKAAKELSNICREHSIDVVHTHFLRENFISILSRFFGNKSLLINTRHMLIENSKFILYANKFMTFFNYKIIAVSQAVENLLLEEYIHPNKIQLIYTGINPDDWSKPDSSSFRREFNLDQDQILIGSVSRFSEEKGHEFLLQSIFTFKNLLWSQSLENLKFKFILVGDGVLLEKSKSLAKELGIFQDIIFTGYRNDISNILNNCNLFISHSKSEAFGISILEAMACGLPVISTDSGGTMEIIGSNNDYGILVDFGNEGQLANALIDLLGNKELMDKYKKDGLNLIFNKFSLDKTAIETYNLYSHNLDKQ